jgi:hypothetical protein
MAVIVSFAAGKDGNSLLASNHRTALDAGRPPWLHVGNHLAGPSERDRSASRVCDLELYPWFYLQRGGWVLAATRPLAAFAEQSRIGRRFHHLTSVSRS